MAPFDVMVGVLANQALSYFVSGIVPRRIGNAHPNIVPYQTFPVRDGHIMLAVGSAAQFEAFCRVIRRSDLVVDDSYRTNAARVSNRQALVGVLQHELRTWDRDDLLSGLGRAGVPAGPINTLGDVFKDPQVVARKLRLDLPVAGVARGRVSGLRAPIRLSACTLTLDRPAPRLGEHTAAIACELGMVS